jgi:excisionase family DNA binding protein
MPNRYLSVREAAELLKISVRQVLGLIEDGRLPATNVGRAGKRPHWRIKEDDLGSLDFVALSRSKARRRRRPNAADVIEFF